MNPMSLMQVFDFKSKEFRTAGTPDAPLFCLADVCRILDIRDEAQVAERLLERGRYKTRTLTTGGEQELWFVTEPGLYQVIFRSNKPEAKAFQQWVFEEVLPSIRKQGGYISPNASEGQLKELHTRIEQQSYQIRYERLAAALHVFSRELEGYSQCVALLKEEEVRAKSAGDKRWFQTYAATWRGAQSRVRKQISLTRQAIALLEDEAQQQGVTLSEVNDPEQFFLGGRQ